MQLPDAISLIQKANLPIESPAHWADLGCGNGLFTYALVSLLSEGSEIFAVDQTQAFVRQPTAKTITVHFQQADFTRDQLQLPVLDGILMANSLHYVHDKLTVLQRLAAHLSPEGKFIIIEYDTDRSNPWVPFPVTFTQLSELFANLGYAKIQKIGERKSAYNQGNLYACLIEK